METLTIEYNEKNKHVKQVLTGLIGAGLIRKKNIKEQAIFRKFKTALRDTKLMENDIMQNGTQRYKTLNDLLNED